MNKSIGITKVKNITANQLPTLQWWKANQSSQNSPESFENGNNGGKKASELIGSNIFQTFFIGIPPAQVLLHFPQADCMYSASDVLPWPLRKYVQDIPCEGLL